MNVILLTKEETNEIRSKGLLLPTLIGKKVVHSYHARNLVKFIGLEALVFVVLIIFALIFKITWVILYYLGLASGLTFIYLVYCGIRDVFTIRKLRKLRGRVTKNTKWEDEDIEFWRTVAKKRRLKLEDFYDFEEFLNR